MITTTLIVKLIAKALLVWCVVFVLANYAGVTVDQSGRVPQDELRKLNLIANSVLATMAMNIALMIYIYSILNKLKYGI